MLEDRASASGGEAHFVLAMEMTATARIAALPEAILLGPLSTLSALQQPLDRQPTQKLSSMGKDTAELSNLEPSNKVAGV